MDKNGKLDKKDLRIMALENLIRTFKRYDKERNRHFRMTVQKVDELESEVKELRNYINDMDTNAELEKLRNKIKSLKGINLRLRLIVEHNKYLTEATDEEFNEYKLETLINELKMRNKTLSETVKTQKHEIDALLFRCVELQRRLEALEGI